MKKPHVNLLWFCALIVSPLFGQNNDRYTQVNLVSDVPGLAAHTDPNLVNAWGIARSATSPWWVNSAGKGLSLVYDATGAPFPAASPIRVTIPANNGFSVPTGIVFNSTSDFPIAPGFPAVFLFSNINGTISGWNPNVNASTAVVKVNTPGAVYTGLTIADSRIGSTLYAANFASGNVDTFDANFNPVTLSPGAFHDPAVPAAFHPFNVMNVGGNIFVEFAQPQGNEEAKGPGLGFVDEFSPNGQLILRLQNGPWMNAPWGVTMAPATFGSLGGQLLVGQFGSGQIAAFNPATGAFEGLLMGTNNAPIVIDGLWGIMFGNSGPNGSPNELYFAAGINDEAHGLFGKLTAAPQIESPGPITLAPGQSIPLNVRLSSAAGPTGVMLTLTSSNPGVVTVTPTAVVAAGESAPRPAPIVTGVAPGQATITISAPGFPTITIPVNVTFTMSFVPASIVAHLTDRQARPLLVLAAPAASQLTIALSSSNASVASTPSNVTIPAGQQSVAVPISLTGTGSAAITATVVGGGGTATLPVTVQ